MAGIVRAFRAKHRALAIRDVNALASAVWRGRTFEEKSIAISLVDSYAKGLDDSSWTLLDTWVDKCVGWGMCDSLGSGPIAKMVRAKPTRFRDLQRWAKSGNPWRRRIAVYALHDWVLAGELDRPFRLLQTLLKDEDFWVRRAVGTWLRESWKRDRKRTESFLREHVHGLPKVVITVATERAPKAFREELRQDAGNRPPT